MDDVFTSIEPSHGVFTSRYDKNYLERIRYWKAQGLSQESAEREAANPNRKRRRLYTVKNSSDASNKAFTSDSVTHAKYEAANPTPKRRRLHTVRNTLGASPKGISGGPATNLEPDNLVKAVYGKRELCIGTTNLPKPETWSNNSSQCYATQLWNLYSPAQPTKYSVNIQEFDRKYSNCSMPSFILTTENNQAYPEMRNSSGLATNFQTPEPGIKQDDAQIEQQRRHRHVIESQTSAEKDYSRPALLIIATSCSIVLIHSLAESLGSGFWNYLIATGFEATPIAVVGTKIRDLKSREKAVFGSIFLFILSLALFISPQVTTILNELSNHDSQKKIYNLELQKYENFHSMLNRAKLTSDIAEDAHKRMIESEGDASVKTIKSKREATKAFIKWENLTKETEATVRKPVSPVFSQEFVSAIQTVVLRIGMFMAAFLSMHVRRTLA